MVCDIFERKIKMKKTLYLIAVFSLCTGLVSCKRPVDKAAEQATVAHTQNYEQAINKINSATQTIEKDYLTADTPEGKEVDTETLTKAFSDSFTKLSTKKNLTVYQGLKINISPEKSTGEGEAEYTLSSTMLKMNEEDGSFSASVSIDNEVNSQAQTLTGYYDGKEFFYETVQMGELDQVQDLKLKRELSKEEFVKSFYNSDINTPTQNIEKSYVKDNDDGTKTYLAVLSPGETTASLNNAAQQNIDGVTQSMTVYYCNMTFNVDKEGVLRDYAYVINAEYSEDELKYDYNFEQTFSADDIGKTTVDVIQDTSEYLVAEDTEEASVPSAEAN